MTGRAAAPCEKRDRGFREGRRLQVFRSDGVGRAGGDTRFSGDVGLDELAYVAIDEHRAERHAAAPRSPGAGTTPGSQVPRESLRGRVCARREVAGGENAVPRSPSRSRYGPDFGRATGCSRQAADRWMLAPRPPLSRRATPRRRRARWGRSACRAPSAGFRARARLGMHHGRAGRS